MSMRFCWFLPADGDGRDIAGDGRAGALEGFANLRAGTALAAGTAGAAQAAGS